MDNYTQDRKCRALEKASLDHERRDPIVLPFSLLKAITKGFSDNQLIGRGGFAAVYKVYKYVRMHLIIAFHADDDKFVVNLINCAGGASKRDGHRREEASRQY